MSLMILIQIWSKTNNITIIACVRGQYMIHRSQNRPQSTYVFQVNIINYGLLMKSIPNI